MPRSKKVISVVAFLIIAALSFITLFKGEWLEQVARWLNMYDVGQMYVLDATRVFQMLALSICSVQLADFLSRRRSGGKLGQHLWLLLVPFLLAFTYFWVQVFTHGSDVFPRNGIIAMNFIQSLILLGYSKMLGIMRAGR